MTPPALRPRILIAEDEVIVARDIQLQLMELGYDPVGHAVRGEEAVTLAATLRPALVLMDIQLAGGMDGITAAQIIRTRFSLPVVFLTAFAADDTLERAKLAEPFGYVLKPFSERELRVVLEMALYKHRTEGQLRESEQKFRSIFNAEPECVKLLSLDGSLLEMNAAGLAMLDAESVEQVQACGLPSFVLPAHLDSFIDLCRRVAQGESGLLEFQTIGLLGTSRWLETHAAPLRDQNGSVIAILGVTRDITGRKQNLLQRRVSDRILGAISQGVVVCNTNQLVESVNTAFTQITGYTEAEVVGRNCRMLQGLNTDTVTLGLMRRALGAATAFEGELLNYRKDGTEFWNEMTISPVLGDDGQLIRFVGVIREISARKWAEEAMRITDHALKAVSQGVLITDHAHFITSANDAFLAITGYTRNEVLGRNCRFLKGPLTEARTLHAMRTALASLSEFSGEVINYRKNGEVFWNELTISPVRGTNGQVSHFIGVTRDVTVRKRSEIALRDTTHQLRLLSQQVLTAQETERRRMAHELHDELGQALTAIKINLQTRSRLNGPASHGLDEENIRILDETLQQVRRLALALRPSMLDDLGLGAALRWLTEQMAARNGMQVKLSMPVLEPRLATDIETACFRIVQEALTNIARHAAARLVSITLHHDDGQLALCIEDDGRGFDLTEARVRALGGASMGILGMRERAILIGGQLEFESSPGKGCKTILRCPLRRQGEAL